MQRLRALAEILDGHELEGAIFQATNTRCCGRWSKPMRAFVPLKLAPREGAQRCVLHNVLRVRAAAGEPARERKRFGEMRHDYTRERARSISPFIAPVDFALATPSPRSKIKILQAREFLRLSRVSSRP